MQNPISLESADIFCAVAMFVVGAFLLFGSVEKDVISSTLLGKLVRFVVIIISLALIVGGGMWFFQVVGWPISPYGRGL